jgi:hypothetical protein
MTRHSARQWVSAVFGIGITVAVLGLVIWDLAANFFLLALVGYVIVGALICWQQPTNRMGWLLLLTGAALILANLWNTLQPATVDRLPTILVIAAQPLITYPFLMLVVLVTLFPSGQAEAPSQRGLLAATGMAAVVITLVMLTGQDAQSGRPNPMVLRAFEPVTHWLINQGFVIVPLLLVGALSSLALRWRVSEGTRRLQFRWLLLGIASLVLAVLVLWMSSWSGPAMLVGGLLFNGLPVCLGVAVAKYHLYDFDRVLSRTASYLIVTGMLLMVFAGVVLGSSALLPGSSQFAVAIATLAAAALAQPLLRRVRAIVDRRFNRARYDAQRVVDEFGSRLRNEVQSHTVVADLSSVVSTTLEPQTLSLWLPAADR